MGGSATDRASGPSDHRNGKARGVPGRDVDDGVQLVHVVRVQEDPAADHLPGT